MAKATRKLSPVAVPTALLVGVLGVAAACTAKQQVLPSRYVVCTAPADGCLYGVPMRAKPATMLLSGDGSLVAKRIVWRGWGTVTATGTGVAESNNCQPNCAQGTFSAHRVRIVLSDPRPWRHRLAYGHVLVLVPAISYDVTFTRGLLPKKATSPPAVTPAAPGPVSTQATISGRCVMGYEPAYADANANVAYGPFTQGPPIAYTRVDGTKYTPTIAYQVNLSNNGTVTAQVVGFAVVFYDAGGAELGSSQVNLDHGEFITSNQSLTWTMYSGTDTYGNGLSGDGSTGIQDSSIPSDGSAASCSFIQWYHP